MNTLYVIPLHYWKSSTFLWPLMSVRCLVSLMVYRSTRYFRVKCYTSHNSFEIKTTSYINPALSLSLYLSIYLSPCSYVETYCLGIFQSFESSNDNFMTWYLFYIYIWKTWNFFTEISQENIHHTHIRSYTKIHTTNTVTLKANIFPEIKKMTKPTNNLFLSKFFFTVHFMSWL